VSRIEQARLRVALAVSADSAGGQHVPEAQQAWAAIAAAELSTGS